MSETVFVALSGGVDSTYALFKLKSQGFNVVALTMDVGLPVSREWIEAAKHAAFSMGVMLNVVNLKDEFQKYVVDYFVKEYLAGKTPNPCAVCNRYIKFGLLRKHALSMGADYYATGHYACLSDGRLMRAKDRNKD
ncbi:MAG: tRNA 2-thiouridine(34) synthase MnmA, partial [Deferribacteres bacterium]|nr:tRNA 2-thiouridine(34) synthase MnmA [Deferribacteres bacterium]